MKNDRAALRRPLAAAGFCFLAAVAGVYSLPVRLSAAILLAALFICYFIFLLNKLSRRRQRGIDPGHFVSPSGGILPPVRPSGEHPRTPLRVRLHPPQGAGHLPAGNPSRRDRSAFPLILMALFAVLGFAAAIFGIEHERRNTALVREENARLTVTVREAEPLESATRITADVNAAGADKITGISVLFYEYQNKIQVGDELEITASFYPGEHVVPGGVRINGRLTALFRQEENAGSLYRKIAAAQQAVKESLRAAMPEEAASVAAAMLTGDRSLMPVRLSTLLQRTGISHIVVVSGLHISFLLGALSALLRPIKSALPKMILTGLFVIAIMFFYGFTPSVVRACVMGLMTFFGDLFYLPADGTTSLSLAAVVILLLHPGEIRNISFQLSFACCFGIAAVFRTVNSRYFQKKEKAKKRGWRLLYSLRDAAVLTLSVSLVTLPVLVLNGMAVSVVSPVANPVVVSLVPCLLGLSAAAAALMPLIPAAGALFGSAAAFVVSFVVGFARFLDGWNFAAADAGSPAVKYTLALSAILAVLLLLSRKRLRVWMLAVCFLPAAVGCGWDMLYRADSKTIMFYNGGALILCQNDGAAVVLRDTDDADMEYLYSYLLTRGMRDIGTVYLPENSEMASGSVRRVFGGSARVIRTQKNTKTYLFSKTDGFDLEFLEDCVIINAEGVAAAASSFGNIPGADLQLVWRSGYPEGEISENVIYYSDTDGRDAAGTEYRYGDVVELLLKNGEYRIQVR